MTQRLIDRMRANKLPRGAGIMYLFCAAVERNETPDPKVVDELATLLRAAIAAVVDPAPRRQQRILKALQLEQRRGRKNPTSGAIKREMSIANDVAIAALNGTAKPHVTVAAKRNLAVGTVKAYYAKHRTSANAWAKLMATVDLHLDRIIAKHGPDPENWPQEYRE